MTRDRFAASVRDAVIGGVVTLIGSLIFMMATGAWAGKENAADHRDDMRAIRSDLRRVLDVVCTDHPRAPQCQSPGSP